MPTTTLFEKEQSYSRKKVHFSAKPFLKWAGGKSQMLEKILNFIPEKYNNYFEPFIGGGAVYFHINPNRAIISDLNEELSITYQQVKDNVEEVVTILESYINTEDFFYKIRAQQPQSMPAVARAARLIFLNKTCFNGLYRVNRQGQFNVPYGKRAGAFLNKENLLAASIYLQTTQIFHSDYKAILKKIPQKGDFIFLDPPYQPVGKYSDFKRYTKERFQEKDQIELADVFVELVRKGCYVILTNSDHPFILDLYKDFDVHIFNTKRLISSNPQTRSGKDIIVIGGEMICN